MAVDSEEIIQTGDVDLGARVAKDAVTFTVWAPRHDAMTLRLEDRDFPSGCRDIPMEARPDGYFAVTVPGARAGQHYWFKLADALRPDPVSRYQPEGVFGRSAIVDPASFPWTDADWTGTPPRHRNVVYEMHIGTFTTAGTWGAARGQLQRLADLGVTTLEIMPLAEFSGRFGWGYDGVFLFAPFHMYGTPDDVRVFINDAHRLGIAVILDVVYNHLGPVGNVLHEYSDWYFADHETEWGRGFNVDGAHSEPVRAFMRANVRHWIDEYHFDGLRFDAVHSIIDSSPEHIVHELTRHARAIAHPRRQFVVAENESQNVAFLKDVGEHGPGGLDGMWNEDWHHAALVALSGQRSAYCTDYDGTANEFAAMARWNLLYQGQWYSWQKQRRGTDSRACPSSAFVCFLENHDQVANTGRGVRLHQLSQAGRWRALVSLLLLGPQIPMLFQGQECATPSPFTYFADHESDLAEAVRKGRLEFLSQFPALTDPETRKILPVPDDEAAFRACRINWCGHPGSEEARLLHTDLLRLRRSDVVLAGLGTTDTQVATSALTEDVLLLRYSTGDDERLMLLNLGRCTTLRMNDPLLAPASRQVQWTMMWCSERAAYGGTGVAPLSPEGLWALQANCAWLFRAEPIRSEAL
ncbi:MAG TPA: alpha-amylase family glycosyl hydrolase [Vicinamibacterales bacterium]|nr:alpha-amylase family glycosyl hydrolase [Vicinamibacterales bacterium]